jgi:hypothetical protein
MTNRRIQKTAPKNDYAVRRGMLLVGGYFTIYGLIGFAYPIVMGENILRTMQRKLGWLDTDGGEKKQLHCCDNDNYRK